MKTNILNLKLEILDNKIRMQGEEIFANDVVINQYFTRQDGFSTSRTIVVKRMTKADYYWWIKRNYRLPIQTKIRFCDKTPPPYFTDNIVDFCVINYKFKRNLTKNKLDIFYKEL